MIERYVQYPETLSEEMRAEVKAFLEENELARRIAAFYRDYYRELETTEREESPSVKSFVDELLDTIQQEKGGEDRASEANHATGE